MMLPQRNLRLDLSVKIMLESASCLSIGMHSSPSSGGADRYFYELTRALSKIDSKQRTFAFEDGEVPAWMTSLGTAKRPLSQRWSRIRELFNSLEGGSYLVASHFALYALPLMFGRRAKRHIVHFHGPWAAESSTEGGSKISVLGKYFVEKLVYRQADHFIVLSEAFRQVLHSSYDIELDKISIIPGGIELHRFSPRLSRLEARRELGLREDGFAIVCVRRLARRMGLENLIEAFSEISVRHPEAYLYIAGKGALHGELQELCKAKGLGERVRLLGFVHDDELPLLYRAADLSIVPSQKLEGFGLVTLESLACGTPVMVTPVGGLPEPLRTFAPQLILDSAATSSVSNGLEKVLSNRPMLPSSEACRAHAETFSWDIIAREVLDIYRKGQSVESPAAA